MRARPRVIFLASYQIITPCCAGMLIGYSPDWNMSVPTNKLRSVTKMLAKNAVQNPEILNPGTSDDTRSIMSALITSKKNPNVMSVSGIVKTITMGLITALAKPNSSAETNKDFLLVNEMPWNIKPASHRDKAVMPQCAMNSIMLCSMLGLGFPWKHYCKYTFI